MNAKRPFATRSRLRSEGSVFPFALLCPQGFATKDARAGPHVRRQINSETLSQALNPQRRPCFGRANMRKKNKLCSADRMADPSPTLNTFRVQPAQVCARLACHPVDY